MILELSQKRTTIGITPGGWKYGQDVNDYVDGENGAENGEEIDDGIRNKLSTKDILAQKICTKVGALQQIDISNRQNN